MQTNLEELQDDFWREALNMNPKDQQGILGRYNSFLAEAQSRIAHLPQPDQDKLVNGLIARNSRYMSIAQKDRNALRRQLGMSGPSAGSSRLVNVAAETAVRATVWQMIAALFRAGR